MKNLILFIAVTLLLTNTAATQTDFFNYTDIYSLQFATNASISPDGNTIIYNRVQYDIMTDKRYSNLWTVGTDGSNHKPLSSGKNNYNE